MCALRPRPDRARIDEFVGIRQRPDACYGERPRGRHRLSTTAQAAGLLPKAVTVEFAPDHTSTAADARNRRRWP
jgi:hypothetical protein